MFLLQYLNSNIEIHKWLVDFVRQLEKVTFKF